MNEFVKDVRVHQLLHGYRRGHELLAGSTRLAPRDADLVTRLSDLSGTLTKEEEFRPYLTVYPLPSGDFYALARTWLDNSAPRAGCVLTHTLLVPTEQWAANDDPLQLASLFSFPSTKELSSYKVQLDMTQSNRRATFDLHRPEPEIAIEFVSRYFEDGLRPLIWFGEPHPEDIAWQILRAIWPRLRVRFACCTLSLQPRSLEQDSFDVMFAPSGVYSRFYRFSGEHILDATTLPSIRWKRSSSAEPWCRAWAGIIFREDSDGAFAGGLRGLVSQLGDDPTAIRRVFLIQEQRNRVSHSPTAAVGVMDLVESIAPDETSALEYKREVVEGAIRSAELVPRSEDAIKSLFLISERLDRPAFEGVRSYVAARISSTVSLRTCQNPELALESAEPLLVLSSDSKESAFVKGVLLGLLDLTSTAPSMLWVLHHFPNSAPSIIASEPLIAVGYLHGVVRSTSDPAARNDLVTWIASLQDTYARKALCDALVPELKTYEDAPIAAELFRDLRASEVRRLLDALFDTTNKFAAEWILRVVEEQVARLHPSSVREWASEVRSWSPGVACLVAASYTPDRRGLQELISDSQLDSMRQAQVVAMFLRMIGREQYPRWFREHAREDPEFLAKLLAAGPQTSAEVSQEVHRVLDEVRDIAVAKAVHLSEKVESFAEFSFYNSLTDAAMRSAVAGFVAGHIPWEKYELWQAKSWAKYWLGRVPKWTLQSLLTHESRTDTEAWVRAWRWFTNAPNPLYERRPALLTELVDSLVSVHRFGWPEAVTECWIGVLGRAAGEAPGRTHLELCVQALRFAFAHQRHPLGGLIAAAFSDVYYAVMSEPATPPETATLFGVFDWDKGKELRRKLVDSFLRSKWRPGDLALAVKETSLLRKIFKRVMREWEGNRYISTMLDDLAQRHEPAAAKIREELIELVRHPDFYEEWD